MSILRHLREGLLVIVAIPMIAFAASDTTEFKVTSYLPVKFRDVQWIIGGGFGLSGYTDESHDRNYPDDYYYPFRSSSTTDHHGNFNLTSSTRYRNFTLKNEKTHAFAFSASYSGDRSSSASGSNPVSVLARSNDSYTHDSYQLQLRPSIDDIDYVYRKFFYAVTVNADFQLSNTPNDDRSSSYVDAYIYPNSSEVFDSGSEYRSGNESTEQIGTTGEIAVGWGRIYVGSYAATALYMVKELRDHNLLVAEPGYQVLDSLTEIVYQYRLKHAVDTRLLHIETLGAIAQFLKSHGIINCAEPTASSYLQDVWDYFPRDDRSFGLRCKLILGGIRDWNWRASGETDRTNSYRIYGNADSAGVLDTVISQGSNVYSNHLSDDSYLRYLAAQVDYENPLSLQTQLSATVKGRLFFNSGESTKDSVVDYYSYYDLTGRLGIGYILSSRSRFDISSNLTYQSRQEIWWAIDDPYGYYLEAWTNQLSYTLQATATYRLNIPTNLRLSAAYSGGHIDPPYWNYSGKTSSHSYSLSLSISHFIY